MPEHWLDEMRTAAFNSDERRLDRAAARDAALAKVGEQLEEIENELGNQRADLAEAESLLVAMADVPKEVSKFSKKIKELKSDIQGLEEEKQRLEEARAEMETEERRDGLAEIVQPQLDTLKEKEEKEKKEDLFDFFDYFEDYCDQRARETIENTNLPKPLQPLGRKPDDGAEAEKIRKNWSAIRVAARNVFAQLGSGVKARDLTLFADDRQSLAEEFVKRLAPVANVLKPEQEAKVSRDHIKETVRYLKAQAGLEKRRETTFLKYENMEADSVATIMTQGGMYELKRTGEGAGYYKLTTQSTGEVVGYVHPQRGDALHEGEGIVYLEPDNPSELFTTGPVLSIHID